MYEQGTNGWIKSRRCKYSRGGICVQEMEAAIESGSRAFQMTEYVIFFKLDIYYSPNYKDNTIPLI